MKGPADSADPFFGNSATDLPGDRGIAKAWSWPKAETGNTHPGAVLPFGMVSVCAYSGGYVTGYGRNMPSFKGRPEPRFDRQTATGFTHFHQSGTGTIGSYYNYLRIYPAAWDRGKRWTIGDEEASPGYYRCTLSEDSITAELTVSPRCAVHRYTFPESEGDPVRSVSVDLSNAGLDPEIQKRLHNGLRFFPTAASIRAEGPSAHGFVRMQGIDIHFSIFVEGAEGSVLTGGDCSGEYAFSRFEELYPFGVRFDLPSGTNSAVVKIGFSFRSAERAVANLAEVRERDFSDIRRAAWDAWNGALGRIRVRGTEEATGLFYSALYHSLVKPTDCAGENPFTRSDGACSLDLATLWDQYKTHIPLLNFIYPEQGAKIVETLITAGDSFGFIPNALLLDARVALFEDQAAGLGYIVMADARARAVPGIDWKRAAEIVIRTIVEGRCGRFLSRRWVKPFSHTINLSMAVAAAVSLIESTEDGRIIRRLRAASRKWRNVFDRRTGMLSKRSFYYEGTSWNYSFPLFHDQAGRLSMFGSVERALETLDRFFGYYDLPDGTAPSPPPYRIDRVSAEHAQELERFEGLNNEPDLDAPFVYHYLGRPDRTMEVVKSALRHRFAPGPGGLAGNNDSGGLTSWYVWACIGLYPVPGQDVYLLVLPEFDEIVLKLPGGDLVITVTGRTEDSIYVGAVTFNGEELERSWIRHGEIDRGGRLDLTAVTEPGIWGTQDPPPSYGY